MDTDGTYYTVKMKDSNGMLIKEVIIPTPFYGADAFNYVMDYISTTKEFYNLVYPLYGQFTLEINYCVNTIMSSRNCQGFDLKNIPYCKRVLIKKLIDEFNNSSKKENFTKVEKISNSNQNHHIYFEFNESRFEIKHINNEGLSVSHFFDLIDLAAWYWIYLLERIDREIISDK